MRSVFDVMTRSRGLLLAALLLLTACGAETALPAETESPTEPPSPEATATAHAGITGHIAYVGGADAQIHLLDLETGMSRQLTQLTAEDATLTGAGPMKPVLSCGFGPGTLAWSPDGSLLAFSYGGCETVLYVVDLDGTVTRVADGRSPAWSPDGRHLVFSPIIPPCMGPAGCGRPPHPGAWDLQVADIDSGAAPVPLMLDEATSPAGQPTWSPDGTLIAFSGGLVNAVHDDQFAATWVARADGPDPRHLANGAWPLGWLMDGRLLITDERTGIVHATDLETGDATTIGGGLSGPTHVSPDGTRYAVGVSDPATGAMGVQLRTVDGEVLMERAGFPGGWAPDGEEFAIVDVEEAGGILVVGRDGIELRRYELPDPFNVTGLAWQPEPEE